MPFELKSNPLENNALFSNSPETESKTAKKQSSGKKKSAKQEIPAEIPAPVPEVSAEELYTRATFIVRRDLLVKLKNYAYTERLEIKEVINDILAKAFVDIEAEYARKGIKMLEKYHLER